MTTEHSRIDQLLKARAEVEQELGLMLEEVSVLFTDVVGSTAYFERYGDIAGLAMVTRYADLANEVVRELGGRPVKTIGDAIMAEFSDAGGAVRAGVEIQRRLLQLNATLAQQSRLQLRVGIHHGKCFREKDDLYGEGVNVAARVIKGCGPAQILVSRSVRNALPPNFTYRLNPLGEIELKKGGEREEVLEVVWTETQAYVELRHESTVALKRGDLVAPGLHVEDLIQPTPPVVDAQKTTVASYSTGATPKPTGEVYSSGATPLPMVSLSTRYEILGELGNGGMGVVYKAKDRETGDFVALKVLRKEVAADAEGMARFKHELRVTRRITHKNVCRIHEFNRTDDSAYISMELVEGESLRQILTRFGAMTPKKGVQIAKQICAGLHEAHALDIIHRDLKPENVMIDQVGNVKLMDFGIARSNLGLATAAGLVIGTPAYMSPEQVQGKTADARSDIYSLGLILYEIFTGTPAIRGKTAVEVVFKQIQEQPIAPRLHDPTLPLHIELAIVRCIEKNPDNRFQSVDELEAALAGTSVTGTTAAVAIPTPSSMPTADAAALAAASASVPTPTPVTPQRTVPTAPAQAPAAVSSRVASGTSATSASAAEYVSPVPMPVARPGSTKSTGLILGGVALAVIVGGFFAVKYFTGSKSTPDKSQPPSQVESQPPANSNTPPGSPPGGAGSDGHADSNGPVGSGGGHEIAKSPPTPPPGGSSSTPPPKPVPEPSAPPPAPVRPLPDYSFSRTLSGHTAGVAAIAFSGDGRLLVSGGMDKTARLWEAGSGQMVFVMKGHSAPVTAVALSPDGSVAASGSLDRIVKLWDIGSGREIVSLPKDTSGYLALAFSPNGGLLAAAMQDGRVKLLDMPSGRAVQSMDAHSGPVHAVAFSPDGRVLATAGRDQKIKLWQVSSGQEIATLAGHADAVTSVAFSSDGRTLASGSEDKTVKLWDVPSRRELRTLSGHVSGVDGVAFSSDGRVLATGSGDKTIKLWEVSTGRELKTLTGHVFGISAVVASRDGRWFASAAGDNTIRIWRRE